MSLDQYTAEQIKEMSMLEVAYEVFLTRKEAISFKEVVDEVAKILEKSEAEIQERIAQFYTDLNIDGRFISLGENRWGLRTWYPYEQIDEEIITPVKTKKKKAKKKDEDEDIVDFDDLDEDDLDYDDFDDIEEDEEEFDDDSDDDVEEEDVDFDDIDDEDEDLDKDDLEEDELLEEDDYDLDDEELEEDEDEDL